MNPKKRLNLTLVSDPMTVRILATLNGDDCLRAVLPNPPIDPRAPPELMEALARWTGERAHAAIAVGKKDRAGSALDLFGGIFLPEPSALVRYHVVPDRQPRRLRGPALFADIYRLHGRG